MSMPQLSQRLYEASQMLSRRGLTKAARWAAEAAAGLESANTKHTPPSEPPPTSLELVAKTYFDNNEYGRCANLLCQSEPANHAKLLDLAPPALFLHVYAKYLYGERRCDRNLGAVLDAKAERPPNMFLSAILSLLEEARAKGKADSFLLYWLGVCYRLQNQRDKAISCLRESIVEFPYNWSAYEELALLIQQPTDLITLGAEIRSEAGQKADEFMLTLFKIYVHQTLHNSEELVRAELLAVEKKAPDMLFIVVQRALLLYHDSQLEEAAKCFERVTATDPFRLEDLDIYSNILYLTGQDVELSILADSAEQVDLYRSETCCIVANCYGLLGEHEMAVVSWQRALASNPNYGPAWTLLGHEYIELKNPNAAIRSYLTATELNARDWNAWYGLGQAYEMLQEWTSCMYYYKRALAVHPSDTRFWTALANCYEKLGRHDEAIVSFEQAAGLSVMEPHYAFRIGLLYACKNDLSSAIRYMKLAQESEDDDDRPWKESASLWLARHYRNCGLWVEAQTLALSLTEQPTHDPEIEREARAILRQVTHRPDSRQFETTTTTTTTAAAATHDGHLSEDPAQRPPS